MQRNVDDLLPEIKRDFKGVWIPKEIWLSTELSIIEKCLLAEIDSLDTDNIKACFASNGFLGNFIGVGEGRCANIIVDLKKRGYLVQVYFDGRIRGLRLNKDNLSESRVHENVKAELTKKLSLTSLKSEHSNTVINTTIKKENISDFSFEDFWKLYPNKVAKSKSEMKWKKLHESEKELIKNTLSDFIAHKPFKDYHHPNPDTYLNNKRWLDEIPKVSSQLKIEELPKEERNEIESYYNNR